MSLIFVALGAILLWFLIAPFLTPAPSQSPQDFDPRVTCAICGELREPDDVVERELHAGRFGHICGACIRDLARDHAAVHESKQEASKPSNES
jgi:hypothetical protein